jgi:hypothetical protein
LPIRLPESQILISEVVAIVNDDKSIDFAEATYRTLEQVIAIQDGDDDRR